MVPWQFQWGVYLWRVLGWSWRCSSSSSRCLAELPDFGSYSGASNAILSPKPDLSLETVVQTSNFNLTLTQTGVTTLRQKSNRSVESNHGVTGIRRDPKFVPTWGGQERSSAWQFWNGREEWGDDVKWWSWSDVSRAWGDEKLTRLTGSLRFIKESNWVRGRSSSSSSIG